MEFSVQNLCGFLIKSKLMSAEGMRAMQQRWQTEAKDQVNSTSQFTKWLVANKYVTEYQASLLAKGHADNFFLGQYMILERLGRGRMAGVFKAAHPLGQIVAIKVLPPSKSKNPLVLGRFQREARLSLKLKHPNVVRTFQVGQSGDLNYLVMEFLEGETLDEILQRRKRLPPAEGVRLIHQALMGLQHIHELGMVHRDLKPANMMLTPSPASGEPDNTLKATVKILDIGLARQMFDESQPMPEANLELTAEGVLLGTPDYLAPEQARDPRAIDVRADIYSLGCVLYHTLTGQPPFVDSNILSQMVRHATEAPKPLKDFNPQIPDGLQQIVSWMLAKKPEERYPTPERAAQALQMFLLADNVPAKRIEDAPQMRSYLTWLETNQSSEASTVNLPPGAVAAAMAKAGTNPTAAPKPLPVATPLPTPAGIPMGNPAKAASSPSLPDSISRKTPRPSHRKEKKHRRGKHRHPIAAPAPVAVAQPLPSATPVQFDVELVGATATPETLRPGSRRDWLLLGLGSALIVGLVLIVLLIISLMRG